MDGGGVVDKVCDLIKIDRDKLQGEGLERVEVDSFNLTEFWAQFESVVQELSNVVTRVGFACGVKPFPKKAEVDNMMHEVLQNYNVMKNLYLLLPEEVGLEVFNATTTAVQNIMSALYELVRSFNDLTEKGSCERLTLTGTFWEACNAIESLPKNNLLAMLRAFEGESALASDALDELTTVNKTMDNIPAADIKESEQKMECGSNYLFLSGLLENTSGGNVTSSQLFESPFRNVTSGTIEKSPVTSVISEIDEKCVSKTISEAQNSNNLSVDMENLLESDQKADNTTNNANVQIGATVTSVISETDEMSPVTSVVSETNGKPPVTSVISETTEKLPLTSVNSEIDVKSPVTRINSEVDVKSPVTSVISETNDKPQVTSVNSEIDVKSPVTSINSENEVKSAVTNIITEVDEKDVKSIS